MAVVRRTKVSVKHSAAVTTVLSAALLAAACAQASRRIRTADYVSTLQAERAAKDDAFRRQVDQPIPWPGRW